MTRLLIECTYVFEHPADNSGIQRVVRNIVGQLPNISASVECIPVILVDEQVYQILRLTPIPTLRWLIAQLGQLRHRLGVLHTRIERLFPFRASRLFKRALYVFFRIVSFCIAIQQRGLVALERRIPDRDSMRLIEVGKGDHLVLLDSSWHGDFFPFVDRLKSQGVGIVSVIYDLIPLTHPQFCDAGLVKVFDTWFNWIAQTAEGYIAISQTISNQVRAEIELRLGKSAVAERWHDHFRLGSDLDLAEESSSVDRTIAQIFSDRAPVYLMVSTIEPRKNHAYLLDAFEVLWAQGSDVRLCIIGKVGWKCDDLLERVWKHREFNKRLFVCSGVDDSSLEFAYKSARALVFPSYVEGFGLPLVEAMQRGLPAMASDIPVFREVGDGFFAFFDLQNPNSLVEKINEFERANQFPAERDVAEWRWPGWREACQEFVEKVHAGVESQQGAAIDRKRPTAA